MARPIKKGLDYFSLDVGFFDDEKIVAIADEFGCKGEVVIIRLLCAIYKDGAYIEFTDLLARVVAKKAGLSAGLVNTVVDRAVQYGFFDKSVFDKYRVLTSRGIQNRYFEAKKKWQYASVPEQFLLVERPHEKGVADEQEPENSTSKSFLQKNERQNGVFCKKTPQSKEKKSKENNTKALSLNNTLSVIGAEQKICSTPTAPEGEKQDEFQLNAEVEVPPEELTEFQIILNTGDMYRIRRTDFDDWVRLYPAVDVPQELRKMEGWANANPKKRKTEKGIRRFINSWLADEQDKGANRAIYAYSANSRVQPLPMSKQQCKPPTIDDCPF